MQVYVYMIINKANKIVGILWQRSTFRTVLVIGLIFADSCIAGKWLRDCLTNCKRHRRRIYVTAIQLYKMSNIEVLNIRDVPFPQVHNESTLQCHFLASQIDDLSQHLFLQVSAVSTNTAINFFYHQSQLNQTLRICFMNLGWKIFAKLS